MMIYQNMDFHNVAELIPEGKAMRLVRIPHALRQKVNPAMRDVACLTATGAELRFRLRGPGAKIRLRLEAFSGTPVACLYYGSIQAGWQTLIHPISEEGSTLHIERPANMEEIIRISREQQLPFDPELFRLVLPSARCLFEGVEGDIEPPRAADLPGKTWLAYGSSITHGSLGLMMPYSYPFRIAQKLGCDHFNMGFAGAAHLEKEVAEYIVSRKDWDFASVEMGVNMVGGYTPEQFEERVDAFTSILAQDGRPVFATDIFGHNIPNVQEKAELFRAIVRKYAQKRLIFTEGLELLNNPAFISEDLVHPSLEGLAQIANRWSAIMRSHLEQNHLL